MTDTSRYSGTYTADTETDLYENTNGTLKTVVYSIGAYNPETTAKAVEIWITDGSNNHKQCIGKFSLATVTHVENQTRYRVLPGYKIRFKSAHANVTFDAQLYEGVA